MNKFFLLVLPVVAFVSGCANLQPLPTPSGKPEVMINTPDVGRVKSALVSTFTADGYSWTQDTPYAFVFTKPMPLVEAALYKSAVGNAFYANPQIDVTLSLMPRPAATRVLAHLDISMHSVFGKTNRNDIDRSKRAHDVQQVLEGVKANVEAAEQRRKRP